MNLVYELMGNIVVIQSFRCVQPYVTPWTVARQAPLSMEIPRQEKYWSELSFLSPGDLPDPGIEPTSPVLAGIGWWRGWGILQERIYEWLPSRMTTSV